MQTDRYEVAVYSDVSSDLATELIELIVRRTMQINDERAKNAIIASALGTAAQIVDGIAKANTYKATGVSGRLYAITRLWKP